MNKRIIDIEVKLNQLNIANNEKIPQCDKNTHFINLTFKDEIDLTDYELNVLYKLPYPETRPLVDTYENLTTTMSILIPNKALKRNGKVKVEFSLKKGEELITINKSMILDVFSTINATYLSVETTGNLGKTIDEQITEIKSLIDQSQEKINDYNSNVINKTADFNKYVKKSLTDIDTYIESTANPNIDDYIEKTSKVEIDNYIETDSKKKLDEYIKTKETEISGATYIPKVNANGDLSWTNNKDLPNPTTVNIKGPKGDVGDKGDRGEKGETGLQGPMGPKPTNGIDYNTAKDKKEISDEIIKQFDDIKLDKGNLPAEINSAENLYTLLEKQVGVKFDSALLYLNDAGVKKKGLCYFDKLTNRAFECLNDTDLTVNDIRYFKDISNKHNIDYIAGLFENTKLYDINSNPINDNFFKGKVTKIIGVKIDVEANDFLNSENKLIKFNYKKVMNQCCYANIICTRPTKSHLESSLENKVFARIQNIDSVEITIGVLNNNKKEKVEIFLVLYGD